MRLLKALFTIGITGFFKTIVFNFRYLPFQQAIHIPVVLSSKVKVVNMGRGRLVLDNLGGGGNYSNLRIGIQDLEYCYDKPSMINIQGKVVLKGMLHSFSPGTILYVGKDAELVIDDGFTASHDLKLYCRHKITIGKDNMWSYYNVVMDNDGHHIYNEDGNHINQNKEVTFGDHVWMGCRCLVLKGSRIADGNIIASGSIVRKNIDDQNCIYGGVGPELLKEHIKWDRKLV